MKSFIFIFLFITLYSCKEKNNEKFESTEKTEFTEIRNPLALPHYKTWGKIRLGIVSDSNLYDGEEIIELKRETDIEPAFTHTRHIDVIYDTDYEVSIIAKKSEIESYLGLRILGGYPDRVDAVFNLQTGVLVGVEKSRDFENPQANIKDLGNGWLMCSIRSTVLSDRVQLLLGPTSGENKIRGWESGTSNSKPVIIVPSSLELEEITN